VGIRLVESRIAGDAARHDGPFARNLADVEEHGRHRTIRAFRRTEGACTRQQPEAILPCIRRPNPGRGGPEVCDHQLRAQLEHSRERSGLRKGDADIA